jgi:histone H3/H4
MFRNEIFVSQIAKVKGIESEISTDVARSILVILENQTLSLIEKAAKFARQFNREELEFMDVECALQEMGDRTQLWNEESRFIWRDNSFIRRD